MVATGKGGSATLGRSSLLRKEVSVLRGDEDASARWACMLAGWGTEERRTDGDGHLCAWCQCEPLSLLPPW